MSGSLLDGDGVTEAAASPRTPARARSGLGLRRPVREDLAFSLLVGCLFTLSPLTGSKRLLPSIVLGSLAGATILLVRLRRPRPAPARAPVLALPGWPAAAVLGLAALAFAPTCVWLYQQYTTSIWRNGVGLFVPFFMLLLARGALRRDAGTQEESSAWGFAFLLPSLALLVADAGVRSHYLSVLSLILALPGLALLLLGARRTRRLALPLALGVFLFPVPSTVEDAVGLAIATAVAGDPILQLLGAPVMRHQSLIRMPDAVLQVSQNCSGLSALHASLAFAAMLAGTSRSRARALGVLLAAYPLVVVFNALRMVALVMLSLRFGFGVLELPIHGLSGIALYSAVLISLWWIADRQGFREAIA
jgi:exosortase